MRLRPLAQLAIATLVYLASATGTASAQEYRGFWVDTFNTALNNHADVIAVVTNAKAANANALLVQVRRRGDSWYLSSLEPLPDPDTLVHIEPGFDPLADLITEGHAAGMEIHAYVIAAAIWNKHPTLLPPPSSPNHVFNLHGFNQATQQIYTGRDNWLTRTLLTGSGITFNGQRFGSDFWIDFGHPDAEAYTVGVLMHLVENYDVDGLHLDRIRYPDFSFTGLVQTPSTGTSIGYNDTGVARFNQYYGTTGNPAQNDPRWNQWRRDQVSNVVRRVYLNAVAVRPRLKLSASLIVYGGAPATWESAEAYWRVYQDWRAWTEEGILDLAIPMNYKREHTSSQVTMFDTWLEWTRNHQYGRAALMGTAPYLNAIEGTLRQVRRSLAPSSSTGNALPGVVFFSMANTNTALTGNPFSIPAGQNTPLRSLAEFASGLTTGKSVNGTVLYQPADQLPLFPTSAFIPEMTWKTDPHAGHVKGFTKTAAGVFIDTGAVTIERQEDDTPSFGRTSVTTATDGGGFYGGVDLAPGTYLVTVTPHGAAPFISCPAVVTAGAVTTLNVTEDRNAPDTTITADPDRIWPPNGGNVTVTLSGTATDAGTGLASIVFRVTDEYGEVEPAVLAVAASGETSLDWERQVVLNASRRGDDLDGRTYTVEATVEDLACNTHVVSTQVVVAHDQRDKERTEKH